MRPRSNKVAQDHDEPQTHEDVRNWFSYYISQANIDENTRSQLAQPVRDGCWRYLEGDSITSRGKRIQMMKLLLLILMPIIILTMLSVFKLMGDLNKHEKNSVVVNTLMLGTHVGNLIHFLQRERDMTAFHVVRSTRVSDSRILLTSTYPHTDHAIELIERWPFGDSEEERAANKLQFQTDLFKHRSAFNPKESTTRKQIWYYTEIIGRLVTWLSQAIQLSDEGNNWLTLITYKQLIKSIEDMGIQRSLGGVFFLNGGFLVKEAQLWFLEKYYISQNSLMLAEKFHNGINKQYFDGIDKISDVSIEQIREMNDIVVKFNGTLRPSNAEMSTWWFDNMTSSLDVYFTIQNMVKESIIASLWDVLAEDMSAMAGNIAILCIIAILSPIIIFSVHSIVSSIQRIARILTLQARDLEKERALTMSLLCQMLPSTVAESLRRNEHVQAENFTEVSIFFSDIVGFTKISAACAPIQVVAMLNSIYNCFDSRIELYEVYKIETIGDAYMVAAGVPKRIGNRHANEVCTMALDLHHHVRHIDIPHLPGTKIHLRVGIHSGPVVAGVVGSKVPRYCLFGETVIRASRMEAESKEDRIHITAQTKACLRTSDGFEIVSRTPRIVKGVPEKPTFWLLKKEGLESTFACYPDCSSSGNNRCCEEEQSVDIQWDEAVTVAESDCESPNHGIEGSKT